MVFSKKWKQKMYEERKHYLDSVKIASGGCMDCGVDGPAEILTFDHVTGEKLISISSQWDVSLLRVKEEIQKCEIVCFNCHQKRTVARIKDKASGLPPFVQFPKIPRFSRPCTISEKIDGTNAIVWVDGDGDVWAGSKSRWIFPEDDNFGFAKWVESHEDDFREHGPMVYRGEWWGHGIQRGYGLKEKRFSLFNVKKWADDTVRPACCRVVPTIMEGIFGSYVNMIGGYAMDVEGTETITDAALLMLKGNGSYAAPGFMDPEGIVIYHHAGNLLFKKTIKGDEIPKSGQKEN